MPYRCTNCRESWWRAVTACPVCHSHEIEARAKGRATLQWYPVKGKGDVWDCVRVATGRSVLNERPVMPYRSRAQEAARRRRGLATLHQTFEGYGVEAVKTKRKGRRFVTLEVFDRARRTRASMEMPWVVLRQLVKAVGAFFDEDEREAEAAIDVQPVRKGGDDDASTE